MAWSDAAARRKYHVGNLRAQLLEEARALVEAGGLAQLNLRSLAARAGIAPGSVYHHYENKAELLAELAATGFQELEQTLEQALAEAPQGHAHCVVVSLVLRQCGEHVGGYWTRGHDVDCHVPAGELLGEGAAETDEAGL